MDKELKQKWLEALRSGNYKQGKQFLKRKDTQGYKHCCLGVLCEVANIPFVEDSSGYQDCRGIRAVNKEIYKGALPFELQEKFGIKTSKISFLVTLNDVHGRDFNQIANYIEENL